ncbi:MAG: hypothetical protein ACRCXC_06925 [Legionella sp.]
MNKKIMELVPQEKSLKSIHGIYYNPFENLDLISDYFAYAASQIGSASSYLASHSSDESLYHSSQESSPGRQSPVSSYSSGRSSPEADSSSGRQSPAMSSSLDSESDSLSLGTRSSDETLSEDSSIKKIYFNLAKQIAEFEKRMDEFGGVVKNIKFVKEVFYRDFILLLSQQEEALCLKPGVLLHPALDVLNQLFI